VRGNRVNLKDETRREVIVIVRVKREYIALGRAWIDYRK